MRALLVDPSLFTAPYDAALDIGLRAAGIETGWATRRLRTGEEADLPDDRLAMAFYPSSEGGGQRPSGFRRVRKGIEHLLGLRELERLASEYDVIHFQWAPLPVLDWRAMRRIGLVRPVVLTVHDTTPLNGARVAQLQVSGFDRLFGAADRLIVHTHSAARTLISQGVAADRISVVPHGPLALRATARAVSDKVAGRWRVVLFGRLQAYKGADLLVEAVGLLDEAERLQLEVVIAGEPLMPIEPIEARARQLGLTEPTLRIRPSRLGEQDMADLLGSADAFVFPYRAIEASGVLFLTASLDKWMIASNLGAFTDAIGTDGEQGALVPPGDAAELARALVGSIGRVPGRRNAAVPSWNAIGHQMAEIYRGLVDQRRVIGG